jgi:hypothetical protein
MPGSAAHADTDGDGRVDYRDLLAIGRNFGETVGAEPVQQKIAGNSDGYAGTHVEKPLPMLQTGESVRLVLRSGTPVALTGLSTRFTLDHVPADAWELVGFHPAAWADEWDADGRLIRFHHGRTPLKMKAETSKRTPGYAYSADKAPKKVDQAQSNAAADGAFWSAAWVHAGSVQPADAEELAVLVIRALTDWQTAPQLRLNRASLSLPGGVQYADAAEWTLVRQELPVDAGRDEHGGRDDLPQTTRLHTGYPNPFNPVTMLSFDLHESGMTRLDVYDVLGKHVATLVDDHREAGRHQVSWDASRHASGMYIVRLETEHRALSRQIMLVK